MTILAADLLATITGNTEALLTRLCAVSSESGNAAGLRQVAELLAAELRRHGLSTSISEEKGDDGSPQPSLLARGSAAEESWLLLLGHLDTVLSASPPRREGRRLAATGALDMKGGLAMLVGALDLLAATGRRAPADLLLVAVPDEESSGRISEAAVHHYGAKARAVLVLEPGEARATGEHPGCETLVSGRRGLTEWQLEVAGRAAHSGLAYWQGRSALAAAADFCARAQQLSRGGPAPTVNVSRLVAGSQDFVGDLAHHYELLGSSRQLNVIAESARAEGEVRYLTREEGERQLGELEALAQGLAEDHQVAMVFRRGQSVPPFSPHGPGAALVRRTVELAAARGWQLEVEEDRGGISFPNFLADPEAVPVIDGLGPTGDGMHVREEFLDLDSLQKRIVLLADLLATL